MSDLKVNPATIEFLKNQNAQRGKRRAIVSIVGLLLVAGIAFGGYTGWKKYKDAHQVAVAKAAVADLKPGNREGWDKMRTLVDKGEITRDQARDAMQEAREKEEQARMDAYFKTPAKDRDEYLDKMIDEMQKRMADWQKNRPTTGPSTRPDRPDRQNRGPGTQPTDAERAARASARADNQSPIQRAQQSEFRAALRARMAARGIEMPRFGGGGPGGGGGGRGGPGGGGGGR